MRCRIAEIEIDSPAHDVIHDHVLARGTKSQRALVFEDVTGVLKSFQIALVQFRALTLQIRSEIAANMRAFIPIQAEPLQSFVNRCHRFLGVSFDVGVFDAQHEFTAVMPRKQPVEQRGARPSNVQVASRRGSETNADFRSH